MVLARLSETDFLAAATAEHCTSVLDECGQAESPTYVRYELEAQALIARAFPLWRVTLDGAHVELRFQIPKDAARPATLRNWAAMPQHFAAIDFDASHNYLKTATAFVFLCVACDVRLVKDGNHRLLQCVLSGANPTFVIYEARGLSWKHSAVDMKNFCSCSSNT